MTEEKSLAEQASGYDPKFMTGSIKKLLNEKTEIFVPNLNSFININCEASFHAKRWLPTKETRISEFKKIKNKLENFSKTQLNREKTLTERVLCDYCETLSSKLFQYTGLGHFSLKLVFFEKFTAPSTAKVISIARNFDGTSSEVFDTTVASDYSFDEREMDDYVLYLEAPSNEEFLRREIPFEELWYAGHVKVSQSVNGYLPELMNTLLLNHNEKRFDAFMEDLNQTQNIMKTVFNGKTYMNKRTCPHRGADLSTCVPNESGHITCPSHGWVFDVITGECIRGSKNASINLERKDKNG